MKEKTMKLNKFIEKMKREYPYYKYINVMSDESVGSVMSEAQYTIVVKNIPRESMREFIVYIKNNILMSCIDNSEELPSIITIQGKLPCGQWPISCSRDKQQLIFDNRIFAYKIAA